MLDRLADRPVVGLVAGSGELIGYGLRLASGYLSDRTRRYWAITLLGYGVNLIAVPLLALAGSWPAAAALMIAERAGKAIRTPARDAMLSHATHQTGRRGWSRPCSPLTGATRPGSASCSFRPCWPWRCSAPRA